MTNYSENPSAVRVDRFKRASGKWYDTFSGDMGGLYDHFSIHEAVEQAILRTIGGVDLNLDYWIYVVNEPYHIHSHPVMLKRFEPDA